MRTFIYAAPFAAFALVAGCGRDERTAMDTDDPVSFTASVADRTRASNTSWSAGDAIGVYMKNAEGVLAANKKYHTPAGDGHFSAFAPSHAIFFPASGAVDFVAYYPHSQSVTDGKYVVDLTEQSVPAAIDFMHSINAAGVSKGESPSLAFRHKLSRIVFAVTPKDGVLLSGMTASVEGMKTGGAFDILGGTLSVDGQSAATFDALVSANGTAATVEAIVMPAQSVDYTVTFALSDGSRSVLKMTDRTYDPGRVYGYALTISPERVEMLANGATIMDWTFETSEELGDLLAVRPGGNGSVSGLTVTTPSPVNVVCDGGVSAIAYTLSGAGDLPDVSARTDAHWVGGFGYGEGEVTFTVEANSGQSARTAAVTLSCGEISKTVGVRQDAAAGLEPGSPYSFSPTVKWPAFDTPVAHDGVAWTPHVVQGSTTVLEGYDSYERGVQFGSNISNASLSSMTMTGVGYVGGVKTIDVVSSAKAGNSVTVSVKVGDIAMTSSNASQTVPDNGGVAGVVTSNFTGAAALTGDIVVTYRLEESGALYVKTISINAP